MWRKIVTLWILSLVVVAALAAGVAAQSSPLNPSVARAFPPKVMSGADLGFRVEGLDVNNKPVGHLVIRVNGEWIEAGVTWSAKPATTEH